MNELCMCLRDGIFSIGAQGRATPTSTYVTDVSDGHSRLYIRKIKLLLKQFSDHDIYIYIYIYIYSMFLIVHFINFYGETMHETGGLWSPAGCRVERTTRSRTTGTRTSSATSSPAASTPRRTDRSVSPPPLPRQAAIAARTRTTCYQRGPAARRRPAVTITAHLRRTTAAASTWTYP